MSIEIVRYTGKTVTPLTDALLFEKAVPINGIYNGCVLSHLGSNQVAITSGNGIIKGRDFKVTAETKLVQLASSGTMPGRIYVKINLSDSVNTIQLLSVCASSLPALVQDANFNLTNGIWEMELATYSATTTAISGLTTTYATVKKSLTENNIVNTNTATEEGTVADARQLNPNVAGSLAYKIEHLNDITLLATCTSNSWTSFTITSLANFKRLGISFENANGASVHYTEVPIEFFKLHSTQFSSIGFEYNAQQYGNIHYSNDTTIYAATTGGAAYPIKIYGIK